MHCFETMHQFLTDCPVALVRLFGNGTTYSPTAEHAGSAEVLREVEDQSPKTARSNRTLQFDEESDVMARKFEIREELCG